jgi:hypothetical protein
VIARPSRTFAIAACAAALVSGAACRKEPEPKVTYAQEALKFLDVFPFPALSGADKDDGQHLSPLQDGYLKYISRDFTASAAEFHRVAAEHPDLVEARFLEGVSLVLGDRPAEAVPVLERVVAEAPRYAPGRWFLGQAYFATQAEAKALEQLREVEALGSEYAAEARKILASRSAGAS